MVSQTRVREVGNGKQSNFGYCWNMGCSGNFFQFVIEPIIPVPLSIQLLGRYSGSIRSFWFIPLNTSGAAAY